MSSTRTAPSGRPQLRVHRRRGHLPAAAARMPRVRLGAGARDRTPL